MFEMIELWYSERSSKKAPKCKSYKPHFDEWVCSSSMHPIKFFLLPKKSNLSQFLSIWRSLHVILTRNHLNDCRATPNNTIHRFIRTHKTNLNSAVRLQFSNAHSLRKWNEEKLTCVYRVIFIISLQTCYVWCWHDFCTIYLIRWAMHVCKRN